MKIAFNVGSDLDSGGGFQYEAKIVELFSKLSHDRFEFYFFTTNKEVQQQYTDIGLNVDLLQEGILSKIHRRIMRNDCWLRIFSKFNLEKKKIETDLINNQGVDLIYFLSPSLLALDFNIIPYVFTVWDLCHRDFNEFPEVRNATQFNEREMLYSTVLKKAVAVTAVSKHLSSTIVDRYGVDSERVKVVNLLPGIHTQESLGNVDIKQKYGLSNDYIFYPAQFWPHKNHIYILKALRFLKENHNQKVDAIFSGISKGNSGYIKARALEYGISDQIHDIGFVNGAEIPYLYKQSLSLVMPTYFGPSNIPPLEAFHFKTPVCYSDLPGLRDQVGDAAFLMDLNQPESLTKHILTIIGGGEVISEKIRLGELVLKGWTSDDLVNAVIETFSSYEVIRECWGSN
ncbi:MAG: glycosyltransferase family 4 protein [Bacteriovoracaceae bacterium]|jgi:glycosyltransferase involved in cell wall biosynthesis|nr:glycosyltransferase family 4 protein [Bacteriovoracaceae bacterium]